MFFMREDLFNYLQKDSDDFNIRICFLHFLLICADIETVSNMVCTDVFWLSF